MTRKKSLKPKGSVALLKKDMKEGKKSLYLNMYKLGKRRYIYLDFLLFPENTAADKSTNEKVLAIGKAIADEAAAIIQQPDATVDDYSVEIPPVVAFYKKASLTYREQKLRKVIAERYHLGVKLRAKAIANGRQSLLLDMFIDGERKYEHLSMYLVPEDTKEDKKANAETMKKAEQMRLDYIMNYLDKRYDVVVTDFSKPDELDLEDADNPRRLRLPDLSDEEWDKRMWDAIALIPKF